MFFKETVYKKIQLYTSTASAEREHITGGLRAMPPAGVQGARPLVEVKEASLEA